MDTPMLIVTVILLLYMGAAYERYKRPNDVLDRLVGREEKDDDKSP